MDILIAQEIALHQYEVRQNEEKVAKLLHPSFREVGVSGVSYEYETTLQLMKSDARPAGRIHAQDFECVQIASLVQLLLYKSVWIDEEGTKSHFAKRASLWVFTGTYWQMKYHQGTPCSAF